MHNRKFDLAFYVKISQHFYWFTYSTWADIFEFCFLTAFSSLDSIRVLLFLIYSNTLFRIKTWFNVYVSPLMRRTCGKIHHMKPHFHIHLHVHFMLHKSFFFYPFPFSRFANISIHIRLFYSLKFRMFSLSQICMLAYSLVLPIVSLLYFPLDRQNARAHFVWRALKAWWCLHVSWNGCMLYTTYGFVPSLISSVSISQFRHKLSHFVEINSFISNHSLFTIFTSQ